MRDVVIVGGGPGGLHAGKSLAAQGFDVELIEEHDGIGAPVHCTGVLGADVFKQLALRSDSVLNPLKKVQFFSPAGKTFSYTSDRVEAVVIDRLHFDRSLADEASSAGVCFRKKSQVVAIELQESCVSVKTAEGEQHRARSCILACGANYIFQRKLGLGVPTAFLQSAQVEVPARRVGCVELHFGRRIAPNGFGWVVPVERKDGLHARVGLMSEARAGQFFEEFVGRVSKEWGLAPGCAPRRKILPLAPIQKTFASRLLVIGDAAGLVKPTTGGGIYYSLISAQFASEVLGEGLKQDQLGEARLFRYQERWQALLQSEFSAQSELRRLAESLDDSGIDDLFELAQTDGIIPLVRRTVRFNEHHDFIRGLLRHPEARKILFRKLMG